MILPLFFFYVYDSPLASQPIGLPPFDLKIR